MFTRYTIGFIPMLIIIPFAALMSDCGKSGDQISVEEIDRLIKHEVPIGSTAKQVIDFLNGKKIEHSELSRIFQDETAFRELELKDKAAVRGSIAAIIRNSGHDGSVTRNIQMYFYFDENEMLIAHTVKQIGTGF
jgi:hypothetical protein